MTPEDSGRAGVTTRSARHDEIPALVRLINQAFRAEAPFVSGERTAVAQLEVVWQRGAFCVVDVIAADGTTTPLAGCVYSERRADGRGYIGMLAVEPSHQGRGLGRLLMDRAEQRCRELGCAEAFITVINLRHELQPFYRGLGYQACGTEPYRDVDRMRRPLHFIVMRKPLA